MWETPVPFLGLEDPLEKGWATHSSILGLPLWLSWWRIRLQHGRPQLDPWVGKIPWRRERLPTPGFWPGEFHGLYSPWGCKESDTTERLSLRSLRIPLWWSWRSRPQAARLFLSFNHVCTDLCPWGRPWFGLFNPWQRLRPLVLGNSHRLPLVFRDLITDMFTRE